MTSTDNPLVDPNSQFQWGDYLPVDDGGDHGGTSTGNPFTPGQGYTTGSDHWLKGLPVLDSAQSLIEDIQGKDAFKAVADWCSIGLQVAGLAAAAATGDWGGLVIAPIASWIMEHVKPLRLMLDELTGNQDTVNAIANTWGNMSGALKDAATQYSKSVDSTVQSWQGDGADAYRKEFASLMVDATAALGALLEGWSLLIHIVSECVGMVHDLVRDLIAALIGQLVQDLAEAATVVGAAAIPEQSAGEIARVTTVATTAVSKVLKAMTEGLSIAGQILSLASEAINVIERLVKAAKGDKSAITNK